MLKLMGHSYLGLGCIACACIGLLNAQTERGTIRGAVRDSSSAVIPLVDVTAVNADTGAQMATQSTGDGVYSLPNLRAGTYRLEASKTGFKKLFRENIRVPVGEVVGVDLQMDVGDVAESIRVTDATPQLKTETSETSTAVNPRTYTDLPVTASGSRSPELFLFLAPGTNGSLTNARINGSQGYSRQLQLDGMNMRVEEFPGDTKVMTMPPDAIQEFSVATSGYSAEFGNSGGGVSRYTVRSGTNELHGNLYEYLRNDVLDARGFFLAQTPVNRQNEFGGSVGGPILIPKVYDGRNRSFFFVNVNRFIFRSGALNTLASVPTPAFKRGDLSELRDPQGGGLIQIYDPATTRNDGQGGFTRDPFPGNSIPSNRISTVSRNILTYVPDPTSPGIVNNFASVGSNRTDIGNYTTKIDHQINMAHRLSGTFNRGFSNGSGAVSPLPPPIQNRTPNRLTQHTARLSEDWIIRPTLVNHVQIGLNRQADVRKAEEIGGGWAGKVGLKGTVDNHVFPNVIYSPFSSIASGQSWFEPYSTSYLINDNLYWIRGKHNLKTGFEFQRNHNNSKSPTSTGAYTFSPFETAFPGGALRATTGSALASYLLGAVDRGSFSINDVTNAGRWTYFAAYVQDDFKAARNLTVNLGLRWDLALPVTEQYDRYAMMDPSLPNPRAGGILGALRYAGFGDPPRGNTRRLTNGIAYRNFGPRIGFAWQARPKAVVRSAYGISYFVMGATGHVRTRTLGWTAGPTFESLDLGVTPAFNWDNGFPQNFDRPPFLDAGFQVGGNMSMWHELAHHLSYRQDWNFGVQFTPTSNWLLDLAYVGAKGTRLITPTYNVNQTHSSYLTLGSLLTRPIDDPLVAAAGFKRPYPTFAGSLAQALRPFPQYLSIEQALSSLVGNSTYHSFQMKVERQFANGLFMLSSFTYAKSITDSPTTVSGATARDHWNRSLDKGLSPYDLPMRLVVAFNYELPVGRGKPFLNVKGPAGKLLEGWQINGILNYQSGEPIGVMINNNLPLFNARNTPDLLQGVEPGIPKNNFDPARDRVFNTAAFANPRPFAYGTAPAVLSNVRGFAFFNENLGLMKRTSLRENVNLEFRFESFNVLNRTQFGNPASNFSDPFNFGKVFSQANQPRQGQFALRLNF